MDGICSGSMEVEAKYINGILKRFFFHLALSYLSSPGLVATNQKMGDQNLVEKSIANSASIFKLSVGFVTLYFHYISRPLCYVLCALW